MAQNADVLITYRENPHTDGFESGERAARLLQKVWQSGERPQTSMVRAPLLWTPGGTATASGPMHELERIARAAEEHPDIWAVNVHGGFCFADTPHSGVSFSVISVGSETAAQEVLDELSECAWTHRAAGADPEPDLGEVLPHIAELLKAHRPAHRRPVVVAEPSDNIGGGAPGDGTHFLRALLETDFAGLAGRAPVSANGANGVHGNSGVVNGQNGVNGTAQSSSTLQPPLTYQPPLIGAVLCDPAAVQQALRLAPREKARLALGGHSGPLAGALLELEVECIARGDGYFQLEDPHSHFAAGGDCAVHMGDSVLLSALPQRGTRNPAHILVTTQRTCPFDLGQWHCMGARPEAFDIIIAKAAVGHRQVYEPIAFALLSVGTPGPCASDLRSLPFRHVVRPTFPLDDFESAEWASTPQSETVSA
jgi:microcystin degradation protein MlrC